MNLKQSIQTEPVTHIDLSFYVETEKGTEVREVIEKMQASHRKCTLVMDRGKMVGIFTERDILKKVAGAPETLSAPIDALMTPDPKTIDADTTVVHAAQIMTENPYRYMPVMNKSGHVVGTLTHYAIIKFVSDHFPEEIYNLPPEPDQIAKARDGA